MIADLSPYFAPATRAKGDHYYRGRRVSLNTADETGVLATVRGSTTYTVTIVFDAPSVVGLCSCPHCLDGNACKHIWATLLAANERGALPTFKRARFELDDPLLDDIDDAWVDEPRLPGPDDLAKYDELAGHDRGATRGSRHAPAPQLPPPRWVDHLRAARPAPDLTPLLRTGEQRLIYVLDIERSMAEGRLALRVLACDRRASGEWGTPKASGWGLAADPDDRRILALLGGSGIYNSQGYGYAAAMQAAVPGGGMSFQVGSWFAPQAAALETVLPMLCATRRFHPATAGGKDLGPPLSYDDGAPWTLALEGVPGSEAGTLRVSGFLRRGDERRPLSEPVLLLSGGVVVDADRLARLTDFGRFDWIATLRRHGTLTVPTDDIGDLLGETLVQTPELPLTLPADLQWTIDEGEPVPRLSVRSPAAFEYPYDKLRATVTFDYDGTSVAPHDPRRGVAVSDRRRLVLRNRDAEERALASLAATGVRRSTYASSAEPHYDVVPGRLPALTRSLIGDGWHVEAHGRRVRTSTHVDVRVTSGIDWFEVQGGIAFGDEVVALPAVMQALARGADAVMLGDGTSGLLPEEWLRRHGMALSLGTTEGGALRFRRSQLTLLDDLLDALPPAHIDDVVSHARVELQTFEGIGPGDPAASFTGTLRPYQRDGLGWLRFLERFGFGGCLADDMGLGKTIQMLAHLDARSTAGTASGPSLIVAPRSVIFNWMAEAARFAPRLRVLDHSGTARDDARISAHDLVLTTYGTLRRDAARLKDVEFDYLVLDEAHAIKNASSVSAKAARLLRARHRVALSGTPVQNHLGELWSLFEFLNPGMLGGARAAGGWWRDADTDPAQRETVRRALRPFVLRRTKEAVATDLPGRIEQTLYCDLGAAQRTLYEQIRRQYHASVRDRIARQGLAKSRMHVLEALLRLRQVACHPGLVDAARAHADSAKLEVLLDRLVEVVEDGHKALVFSQFTSLLAFVRRDLDKRGIAYAYLDGRTKDREARVDSFQQRDDLPVFLISLKAGGLGLNLTAADYVFLLDPWWNPATEAQAIDRAHRIGQTRPVIACRLIARDTVEERILDLQAQKRGLADAIIAADAGLISTLTTSDLELLLG
ncbi:MAG: DEAD/DEAH box helicase [Acidobacteria bacterium]|nr:DEAD/DEAH box helicase [Acidobacteriota bacterium]